MATRSPGSCSNNYCPLNYTDQDSAAGQRRGAWRNEKNVNGGLVPIPRTCSNNYSQAAKMIRDSFKDYFNSPEGSGKLIWSHEHHTGLIQRT